MNKLVNIDLNDRDSVEALSLKLNYKHPLSRACHDYFETPSAVWELIDSIIPRDSVVWDPFLLMVSLACI